MARNMLVEARMAIRRYEDLIAWQLAIELDQRVVELTDREPACRDWKFCDQIRDASAGIAANIAEGFGRYGLKEFAQYLRVARASLDETTTRLRQGHTRGYWTDAELTDTLHLASRTRAAIVALLASVMGQLEKRRSRRPKRSQAPPT